MASVSLKKYINGVLAPILVSFRDSLQTIQQTLDDVLAAASNVNLVQTSSSVIHSGVSVTLLPTMMAGFIHEYIVNGTALLQMPLMPGGVSIGEMKLYISAGVDGCVLSLDSRISPYVGASTWDAGLTIPPNTTFCFYIQIRSRTQAYIYSRQLP